MPSVANGLEADLCVTPVRRGIAQIGVEADDCLALRKCTVSHSSGDAAPISAPTLLRRGIDGSNGCGVAHSAGKSSDRHGLIVNSPEQEAITGRCLRYIFALRRKIVGHSFHMESRHPVEQKRCVVPGHGSSGTCCTRIAWWLAEGMDALWNWGVKPDAEITSGLNEPTRSLISADHARVIDIPRLLRKFLALGSPQVSKQDGAAGELDCTVAGVSQGPALKAGRGLLGRRTDSCDDDIEPDLICFKGWQMMLGEFLNVHDTSRMRGERGRTTRNITSAPFV